MKTIHIYSIVAIVIVLIVAVFIFNKKSDSEVALASPTVSATVEQVASNSQTMQKELTKEQQELQDRFTKLMAQDKIAVTIKTQAGDVSVELYPKLAPKTVANFLALSLQGFYDGLKFHRVVDGFVIQGGDPLSRTDDPRVGSGGPGYAFEDEINPRALGLSAQEIQILESQGYKYSADLKSLPMKVGALAMANSGPNTNGSQFFIVTDSDQPHLNGRHTVFGEVVSGLDAARKVKQGDTMSVIIE